MTVCDICWSPEVTTSGQAVVRKSDGSNGVLLFGDNYRNANVDLCKNCLELLRLRDWHGISERATNATIRRLEAS